MKIEQDIASEEYEDLLTRVESLEKITVQINIGGDLPLGNVSAKGLITGIFRSGDGIKDVDLDGFQMDGDELVGQASGVDQVVLSGSTGLLTAGAGNVVLDADGITLVAGDTYVVTDAIEWKETTQLFGRLTTEYDGTGDERYGIVKLSADKVAGASGLDRIELTAENVRVIDGILEIRMVSGDPLLQLRTNGADKFALGVDDSDSDKFKINSGGSLADPSDFEMDSSGNVEIAGTLSIDTIGEKTAAAGVTIDSLLVKDGTIPKTVLGAPTELTLDTDGEITVTQSYHSVDTFEDAGTDDLDTINGGANGMLLVLTSDNAARDTTVKDGTGNIELDGGADFTLSALRRRIILQYDSRISKWVEWSRSSN